MKYSLSPREIPRAPPSGFPSGSGYISQYIPPLFTIQIQYYLTTILYSSLQYILVQYSAVECCTRVHRWDTLYCTLAAPHCTCRVLHRTRLRTPQNWPFLQKRPYNLFEHSYCEHVETIGLLDDRVSKTRCPSIYHSVCLCHYHRLHSLGISKSFRPSLGIEKQ